MRLLAPKRRSEKVKDQAYRWMYIGLVFFVFSLMSYWFGVPWLATLWIIALMVSSAIFVGKLCYAKGLEENERSTS